MENVCIKNTALIGGKVKLISHVSLSTRLFYEYYCHIPSYSLCFIFYQRIYGFIPVR